MDGKEVKREFSFSDTDITKRADGYWKSSYKGDLIISNDLYIIDVLTLHHINRTQQQHSKKEF